MFFGLHVSAPIHPISPQALGLYPLGVTIYGQLHRHPATTLGLGSAHTRSGRHARCSQPKRAAGSCNASWTRGGPFLLGPWQTVIEASFWQRHFGNGQRKPLYRDQIPEEGDWMHSCFIFPSSSLFASFLERYYFHHFELKIGFFTLTLKGVEIFRHYILKTLKNLKWFSGH